MKTRSTVALALLLALALDACGSRSGLRVPCRYRLERVLPVIVFAINNSNAEFCLGGPARGCPTVEPWVTRNLFLAQATSQLDAHAWMGAFEFPQRLHRLDERMCPVPSEVRVPIAPSNANRIVTFVRAFDQIGAGSPMHTALDLARRALSDPAYRDRPRHVVFVHHTENCDGPVAPAADRFEQVATMAREGISTLVVDVATVSAAVHRGWDALQSPLAVAGGLARPGHREAYYEATDLDVLREAIDREFIAPTYCRYRVALPPDAPEALLLAGPGLTTAPRDPSRANGWDFADAARTEVRVYGAACAVLAASRAVPELTTERSACVE